MSQLFRALIIVGFTVLVCSCGQKGPLILPDDDQDGTSNNAQATTKRQQD